MNDITQKIRDIAYSNAALAADGPCKLVDMCQVTCNSSNQGHHGRRLSKPAFEAGSTM